MIKWYYYYHPESDSLWRSRRPPQKVIDTTGEVMQLMENEYKYERSKRDREDNDNNKRV